MNNKTPCRVLLIEDNPVQSRVLQKKIESAGYGVDIARTGDQGLAKAIERSYDLIIIDYFMPGFTGLDVMRSLSARGPLPPLIMVTGSGSERTAVDAMKLGAKDFLVKDPEGHYLGLLPGVMARIIQEQRLLREKRESERALLETQARYRSLFENIPIGLYQTTPDGLFIDANPAFIQMVGVGSLEELRRLNANRFYMDSGDRTRWQELLASRGIVKGFESELLRPDGTIVWVEDSARIVRDDSGNVLFYEGSLQDITFRKKAALDLQRERDRFQNLLDVAGVMILALDDRGRIQLINKMGLQILEHTDEAELIGEDWFDSFIPEQNREEVRRVYSLFMAGDAKPYENWESPVLTRTGREKIISWSNTVLKDAAGAIVGTLSSGQDITERRKAEEDLRRMSGANASLAELSGALLSAANVDDISALVLEKAKALTGSRHGFVGYIDQGSGSLVCPTLTRGIWESCRVTDKDIVFKNFRGLWGYGLKTKKSLLTNNPSRDPQSRGVPVGHLGIRRLLTAPALLGERLIGMVGLANSELDYKEQDLEVVESLASLYAIAVERKRMEETILRARDFYLTLFAEFPAMIWRSGPEGRRDYFNQTWLEFTGMTEADVGKLGYRKATHPADRKEWDKKYNEAFKALKLFEMEYRMRRRDGVYRWVSDIARPFFDFEGRFGGYIGACFDITTQKDTEEWLRHVSHHDPLTRLYNRAYFEEEMLRVEHGRNFPVSILMADVDGLKRLNDTLGHPEGDKLLVRAAEALRGVFRPSDAVARIGGDEFAVILPGMDSRVASGLIPRIRRRLKEYNRSVPGIPVGLSLGIATGRKGCSMGRLLKGADSRMYQNKKARAGRRPVLRKSTPAA